MIVIDVEDEAMKISVDSLEQKRVELFRLRDELVDKKRNLQLEIRNNKNKLDEDLESEREFRVMCNNLSLGKGKYYELSNMAFEIQCSMLEDDYKDLSEEEQDKIQANYELAVKIRDDIESEYERLLDTREERQQRIRMQKRKLIERKKDLYLTKKKEKKVIIKVKRIDKRISALIEKTPSNKVTFRIR